MVKGSVICSAKKRTRNFFEHKPCHKDSEERKDLKDTLFSLANFDCTVFVLVGLPCSEFCRSYFTSWKEIFPICIEQLTLKRLHTVL